MSNEPHSITRQPNPDCPQQDAVCWEKQEYYQMKQCLLLFFITLKITKKKMFSFVASLFFASHPIHTGRVTNMTAAFDIYGILFMLLAFYFYILASNKKHYYFLSILFYVLALFSSEEAITLILILLLYDLSFNYKINMNTFRSLFKKYLPYIITSIFYNVIFTWYKLLKNK